MVAVILVLRLHQDREQKFCANGCSEFLTCSIASAQNADQFRCCHKKANPRGWEFLRWIKEFGPELRKEVMSQVISQAGHQNTLDPKSRFHPHPQVVFQRLGTETERTTGRNDPVDLCDDRGRLNPAARGWSRRRAGCSSAPGPASCCS